MSDFRFTIDGDFVFQEPLREIRCIAEYGDVYAVNYRTRSRQRPWKRNKYRFVR